MVPEEIRMSEHRGRRRALIVQHGPDTPAGWIGERAAERGLELVTIQTSDDIVFPDPADVDLIITLGSVESVYDRTVPWISEEVAMLRRAVERGVPILGICFGAQILAYALGGRVMPSTHPELGWRMIDTDAPDLVSPGPWLESHFDSFILPNQAVEIARTSASSQAFTCGPHLGVQFHPEITSEMLARWMTAWRLLYSEKIAELGVDLSALQEETERRAGQTRKQASRLFDAFYDRAMTLTTT
jgi:GMP synthase (glutamine-hydrolysing)